MGRFACMCAQRTKQTYERRASRYMYKMTCNRSCPTFFSSHLKPKDIRSSLNPQFLMFPLDYFIGQRLWMRLTLGVSLKSKSCPKKLSHTYYKLGGFR